ncbi:lipopolysaccharide heptosyltransferase I [Arcobacter sp. LA11]|uniref:lipopolysaccharide heptosyltransferase I n=1 Tax=Arcobacter sp. LA11 TaxID=1898176 RepID=UPI0009355A83|nr:lipopolysaccharide heptosyltransferase I [Arcobacter sp. LA11]
MKIAIVKLSAMGDIIHAMVALQFIKKKIPNIQIDWFVEEAFSKVLEYNPHIDNIYKLNLKSIKKDKKNLFSQVSMLKEYSKNDYDFVIDAQGLIKSAIVSKYLGKNRIGFDKKSTREGTASFFYTKKINSAYDKNVIDRNIDILCKSLDIQVSEKDLINKEPFLFFEDEPREIYPYLRSQKRNVLFIVGASWSSKMYSKENFAKIINYLSENCLIAWGNDEEKEIADEIALNSSAIVLPKLDLNNLKAVIKNCDLVIGNDTGPTHMAWALNIPSITIFGCTPGNRNTYLTNVNKIIESDSVVNPLKLNKDDYSIKDIEVKEIVNLAEGILYEGNC